MYVHLGGELCVPEKFIVAILDFDELTKDFSQRNRAFLEEAEANFALDYQGFALPQSLVLCLDRIYLSPLSTTVLMERMTKTGFGQRLNESET